MRTAPIPDEMTELRNRWKKGELTDDQYEDMAAEMIERKMGA